MTIRSAHASWAAWVFALLSCIFSASLAMAQSELSPGFLLFKDALEEEGKVSKFLQSGFNKCREVMEESRRTPGYSSSFDSDCQSMPQSSFLARALPFPLDVTHRVSSDSLVYGGFNYPPFVNIVSLFRQEVRVRSNSNSDFRLGPNACDLGVRFDGGNFKKSLDGSVIDGQNKAAYISFAIGRRASTLDSAPVFPSNRDLRLIKLPEIFDRYPYLRLAYQEEDWVLIGASPAKDVVLGSLSTSLMVSNNASPSGVVIQPNVSEVTKKELIIPSRYSQEEVVSSLDDIRKQCHMSEQ
jgi:hypothetical protein